jgi:adenosine deaminase
VHIFIKKDAFLLFMYDYLRHPHVVNNVVRRHIQIPVYSQTQETIYFDEWQAGCDAAVIDNN